MEKFLSIPVTSEQNQLVSATGIVLIEQASTTTVTITYNGGKVVTLTHATAGAGVETERDAIQNAVIAALQTPWYKVSYQVTGLPFAVSGIAVA
jgi:archaellum component FlaF (FlaF/FlaG flagellin family)